MMNPVFIAVLSIALLWLVTLLRRGSGEVSGRATRMGFGPEAPVRLPERSLFNQCLSTEDLEFVKLRKSRELLDLFLYERRRLAISWLRATRRESQRLLRFHVHSVRYAADLRPAAEARLVSAVLLFMLVYAAIFAAVLWCGPLRTRRWFESVRALSGVLARLADRIAAAIVPGRLPAVMPAGVAR